MPVISTLMSSPPPIRAVMSEVDTVISQPAISASAARSPSATSALLRSRSLLFTKVREMVEDSGCAI